MSPRASPIFGSPGADLLAAGILSAVAGYVDAAGFLGLFGLFTAHVTGDLVAAGTTLAAGTHHGVSLRLATLVVFVLSVATAALVANTTRRRGNAPVTALFALMTLSLAVFCASGVTFQSRLHGAEDWAVVLTGAAGIFGMGIQNALMRGALSSLGPTTLMTGNLTQLTMDLVDIALPQGDEVPAAEAGSHRTETRRRLSKSATSVSAFLVGTVLGGIATTAVGFWSIALPVTVVGTLTVWTWMQSHARAGHRIRDEVIRSARRSGIQRRFRRIPEVDQRGGACAGIDVGLVGTDERVRAVADLEASVGELELCRVFAEVPITLPVCRQASGPMEMASVDVPRP